MSKSTSPRAKKHDWSGLLDQAHHADRQLSAEELDLWRRGVIDGTGNGWHVDLIHAAQRSIEGRDHSPLLAWLDAAMPVPGFAAPLIADALRTAVQGTATGAPSLLTAHADRNIRNGFERLVLLDTKRGNKTRAKQMLAEWFDMSIDSIERSLKRTE